MGQMLTTEKALFAASVIGSGLWLFGGTPFISIIGISVGAFLLFGGWRFVKQLQTFPRDFR